MQVNMRLESNMLTVLSCCYLMVIRANAASTVVCGSKTLNNVVVCYLLFTKKNASPRFLSHSTFSGFVDHVMKFNYFTYVMFQTYFLSKRTQIYI